MSSQLDLQEDIYNHLTSLATVKVYDFVPANESDPYIVIGDTISTLHNTDTSVGTENVVSFHIHTAYEGKKRCKEIMKEIQQAFNRDTTFTAVNVLLEYQNTFKDKNGINTLGLMRFRFTMEN